MPTQKKTQNQQLDLKENSAESEEEMSQSSYEKSLQQIYDGNTTHLHIVEQFQASSVQQDGMRQEIAQIIITAMIVNQMTNVKSLVQGRYWLIVQSK